jgi:hypothetical protein
MNRVLSGVLGLVLALVVLAAGGLNLVLGISHLHKLHTGQYAETQATITRIETVEVADSEATGGTRTEYEITVEYTLDGKKVVTQLGEIPKDFYEGMELTVLYNVDKPTDVTLPGTTGSYIMIGMGAVAVLLGVVMILRRLRGR